MDKKYISRRNERESAFIYIYEKMISKKECEEIIAEAEELAILNSAEEYTVNFYNSEFSKRVFVGVFDKLDEIDSIISRNLKNRTLDRVSKVNLSILRLAVYEILYNADLAEFYKKEYSYVITVNDAVELSKKYTTLKESKFVNGLLRCILEDLNN